MSEKSDARQEKLFAETKATLVKKFAENKEECDDANAVLFLAACPDQQSVEMLMTGYLMIRSVAELEPIDALARSIAIYLQSQEEVAEMLLSELMKN